MMINAAAYAVARARPIGHPRCFSDKALIPGCPKLSDFTAVTCRPLPLEYISQPDDARLLL
jgi:hypothetical protein